MLKEPRRYETICFGRVPVHRPSAAIERLKHEARFFEKDDGSFTAKSPFLIHF